MRVVGYFTPRALEPEEAGPWRLDKPATDMLRSLFPRVANQFVRRTAGIAIAGPPQLSLLTQHPFHLNAIRWKHHPSKGLKTKQAAAKRFIRVGRGGSGLKFGSAGKAHLNVRHQYQ